MSFSGPARVSSLGQTRQQATVAFAGRICQVHRANAGFTNARLLMSNLYFGRLSQVGMPQVSFADAEPQKKHAGGVALSETHSPSVSTVLMTVGRYGPTLGSSRSLFWTHELR